MTATATKSAAQRIYRIPIPTGKPIVCRKVLLALTEWRAVARGIQHFDEESGRASRNDLFVIEASDKCHIEVQLYDEKRNEEYWAPAHYDESGEYALTLLNPKYVSVVLRPSKSDSDSERRWKPVEVIVERPKRATPSRAIGLAKRDQVSETVAISAMSLWQ